jgi:D-glycero-D-manno-heptose 1,7-bisphosphate phosphatase
VRKMNKAVFLDRDGTINKEVNYLSKPEDLEILPGVFEALKIFRDNGYKLIVISNQAGLAKGIFTHTDLESVNMELDRQLLAQSIQLDGFYFCPHHPEGKVPELTTECKCRKPAPGLLLQAMLEHKVDPEKSYMIGDKLLDVAAGKQAGCKSGLVLTGYGREEVDRPSRQVEPDFIVENLVQAAKLICPS